MIWRCPPPPRKTLVFAAFLMFMFCLDGKAQFIDRYLEDFPSGESPQGTHTGTDAIIGPGGGILQVSVVDGNNGGIYWRTTKGNRGNKTFQSVVNSTTGPTIQYLQDPDVALTIVDGKYIAIVVGINPSDNLVYAYNFEFSCEVVLGDVSEIRITEPTSFCKLGTAIPLDKEVVANHSGVGPFYTNTGKRMLNRRCKSPNVDANQDGKVAITWVEDAFMISPVTLDAAFATMLGISANLGLGYRQGAVMATQGNLVNGCPAIACSLGRKYVEDGGVSLIIGSYDPTFTLPASYSSTTGMPVAAINDHSSSFYYYNNADVAIGEGSNPVITYVYVRGENTPFKGSGPMKLTTFQNNFGECNFDGTNRTSTISNGFKEDWSPVIGDLPRIAATNVSNSADFVASLGSSGGGYDCSSGISTTDGKLGFYWRKGTTFGYLTGNASPDITSLKVYRPAISYNSDQDRVSVVWNTVLNTAGNLLAKDYRFNGTSALSSYGDYYSYVNSPSTDVNYPHDYPSIASGNTGDLKAYFWIYGHASDGYLLSRLTQNIAGYEALSNVISYEDGFCTNEGSQWDRKLGVSPNPTHDGLKLDVNLEGAEKVILFNQYGTQVFESKIEDKHSVKSIHGLAPGLYNALITKKGKTQTTKLIVK